MEYKAVYEANPSTELTHWKYTKREKVNGKWRYYYDDDKTSSGLLLGKAPENQIPEFQTSGFTFDDYYEKSGESLLYTFRDMVVDHLVLNSDVYAKIDRILNMPLKDLVKKK